MTPSHRSIQTSQQLKRWAGVSFTIRAFIHQTSSVSSFSQPGERLLLLRHRGAQAVTSAAPGQPPKLLDQVSNVLRTGHYSLRTEKTYIDWIYRFILFHNKRHPREMGVTEIGQFLTHLAVNKHVAVSTQNQALAAILFLYKQVLKIDFARIDFTWAKRPEVLPVILNLDEVRKLIGQLAGTYALMAKLLYGCGLRISECAKLRVHPVR